MLINLWSTPRTGSVWYSLKLLRDLQKTQPNAILLTQFLNRYHMNMYRRKKNGSIQNVHIHEPGDYYEEYQLTHEGQIISTTVFSQRTNSIDQEERHRINILKKFDNTKFSVILHNHVMIMLDGIYDDMVKKADVNIYSHRRNFRDQLSSYAVAFHTKIFAQFSIIPSVELVDITVDAVHLKTLTDRIIHWQRLDKSMGTSVCYEDINFDEYRGTSYQFPIKQNATSAFDKLSVDTQNTIILLENYHASANRESH